MGGYNSGRQTGRPTVESGFRLDINRLIRCRDIRPGARVAGILTWTNTDTGERVASISYEANLTDPVAAWFRLQYKVNGTLKDYRVNLDTTPCQFGGVRWWWRCPLHGRRAAKLYLPPGATTFACRQSYQAAYRSQRETPLARSHARQRQLYEKLRGEYRYFEDPPPRRPKGMHHATYERIEAEIYATMERHNDLFEAGAARILNRLDRQLRR
jgi:hypothetical protein